MVQFKLQYRGLVRKVTFKNVEQPSWHELSWKVGDLCNIPHAAVALTYLDPDGDKITISSQAELKEYYNSLYEEDLSAPHKFIVRNLNEGSPDDAAFDPREDMFLMRDGQTMAASTVGGGSQWGFNPEDEAERDPTKLRLSGYSTFADALSPLARSAGGTDLEDASSPRRKIYLVDSSHRPAHNQIRIGAMEAVEAVGLEYGARPLVVLVIPHLHLLHHRHHLLLLLLPSQPSLSRPTQIQIHAWTPTRTHGQTEM
ncbi:hypothetical protein B0J17DRAFT_104657 [Rhizoctonia solani]|nr:hypothetical protein B0J17DRAFT_104657 [Rhizoctonia solani]